MDKDSRDSRFVRKPFYPGGKEAYTKFITSNLVYPKEALENKIEGQVRLKYDVNYKGEVTGVKVLSSLGYGCDEEASRIIKLLKFEVPKGPRKVKVLFQKTVSINFKLPKQKVVTKKIVSKKPMITSATSIQYNFVPTKKPAKEVKKKVYQYVVKIG